MDVVAKMISGFFDILLLPFGKAHHTLGLVWLSLLTGAGMAFVFKWTSNDKAIRRAKDRLKGRILEMRIYQDDPTLIVKAFGGTLRSNVVYLGTFLRPFAVLIVPVAIVFMQMDERYGRANLPESSTTVLSVQLREGFDPFQTSVTLDITGGVVRDSNPVRVSETREIDWRLRVARPGTSQATLIAGGASYTVPIVAETNYRMIGRERNASSFMEALVHPALPAIPKGSPFQRVQVTYPSSAYPLLIWHVHWIVIFLVYSFLAALALKFIIKFEI
jgi:hypothetical protein